MAHIFLATVPIAGHVHPLVPVARELVTRGHRLTWYTGAGYAETVRAVGAEHAPYRRSRDFDDARIERSFPARTRHAGLSQLRFDLRHIFVAQAAEQLHDLEALAAREPPALVIADPLMLGALLFKRKTGIPSIAINVVAYPMRSRSLPPFGLGLLPSQRWYAPLRDRALHWLVSDVVFADVQRDWRRICQREGLSAERALFDAGLDATWFVQPTIADFEYARPDWPSNVRLVGALHRDSAALPAHTELLAQLPRPLVHVTQGTTSNDRPTLIGPALDALAGENVGVLVATGGRSADELGIARLPDNARLVPFISYPALLRETAVMITNGGYGGVQLALAHGVPLVVWGTSEDKPETAARVAWSGVGVRLNGRAPPRSSAIRAAVREVLANPSYRARARALAAEYARADAVRAIADLSEQTLSSNTCPAAPPARR